jgi:DivIVA domain-containing protein
VVHLLLYGVLAIVLGGALFALAARFLPAGEQIAPPIRDEPPWDLPADRAIRPEDVDSVRLPVALRGYRFAETDTLLDRLAGELAARDQEIARLRVALGATPADVVDEAAEAESEVEHPPLVEVGAGDEVPHEGTADPESGAAAAPQPAPASYPAPSTLNARYDPSEPRAGEATQWATSPPPWAVVPAPKDSAAAPAERDPGADESGEPAGHTRRWRRRRT